MNKIGKERKVELEEFNQFVNPSNNPQPDHIVIDERGNQKIYFDLHAKKLLGVIDLKENEFYIYE